MLEYDQSKYLPELIVLPINICKRQLCPRGKGEKIYVYALQSTEAESRSRGSSRVESLSLGRGRARLTAVKPLQI